MEVKTILSSVPEGGLISYYEKFEGRKAQRITGTVVDRYNSGGIGVEINGNVRYIEDRNREVYHDIGPVEDTMPRPISVSRKPVEPSYTFE